MTVDTRRGLEADARAWVASQLFHGRTPAWIEDRLCKLGVDESVARAEVREAADDPLVRAGSLRTQRTRKMDGLLDAYASMYRRSSEAQAIPEVTALGKGEFLEEFYYRNRPVIVRGGASHWPAVANWTPASFRERFGAVEIEYLEGANRYRHAGDVQRRTTVAEFVDRVESTRASNEFYIVATNLTFRRSADLLPLSADLRPLPFLPPIPLDDPGVVNLWFGPRGTITPLHHDVMNVVFSQVYGRKEFVLAPSFSMPAVYNRYNVYSDVDPIVIDRARFPRAESVPWLRAAVAPGDVLFIPAGWWHWVFARDTSISISLADFMVDGVLDRLGSLRGDLDISDDHVPASLRAAEELAWTR